MDRIRGSSYRGDRILARGVGWSGVIGRVGLWLRADRDKHLGPQFRSRSRERQDGDPGLKVALPGTEWD